MIDLIPVQFRLLAIAIAAAAIAIASFGAGWTINGWRSDAKIASIERNVANERAHAAEVAQKEQARMQAATDSLFAQLEAERAKVKVKDRIIIKEVVRYEQIVPIDRRVELDGAWRVLHDAAASGEPAETSTISDGTASPVTDASALETVSENYADCRGWRDQVIGWQKFWDSLAPQGSTK